MDRLGLDFHKKPLKQVHKNLLVALGFCLSVYIIFISTLHQFLFRNHEPQPLSIHDKPRLRLNENGEFHITVFSDLHYGEEEDGWGIEQDINSTRVIQKVLEAENPDLVILNGDLITSEDTFRENGTKYFDIIAENFVKKGIPWASTYGNHDGGYNMTREALFKTENQYDLSYTQQSASGVVGTTNYWIPIYPSLTPNTTLYNPNNITNETIHLPNPNHPVLILWFFDSLGNLPYQTTIPDVNPAIQDWVDPSVVPWFLAQTTVLQDRYGPLPSLAFVHIPPSSFRAFQDNHYSSHLYPGLNEDRPLARQGNSRPRDILRDDPKFRNELDTPFMQSLVDTPMLHSIYSGHDHGNAWCGTWPDNANVSHGVSRPKICSGKKSGYGGYGEWNKGARILNLRWQENEKLDVETWIRMEDNSTITRVHLNDSYGKDVYEYEDGERGRHRLWGDWGNEVWVDDRPEPEPEPEDDDEEVEIEEEMVDEKLDASQGINSIDASTGIGKRDGESE